MCAVVELSLSGGIAWETSYRDQNDPFAFWQWLCERVGGSVHRDQSYEEIWIGNAKETTNFESEEWGVDKDHA